jgi:hypothetical protein
VEETGGPNARLWIKKGGPHEETGYFIHAKKKIYLFSFILDARGAALG